MSLQRINNQNIRKVKAELESNSNISISRIAHNTGLHFYAVQDILNLLVANGDVTQTGKKYSLSKGGKK
jgi:predicted transcriptional regulator